MSYEFNPDSQTFEFPNPYKVENQAIILSGALMVLVGAGTMLSAREHLAHGPGGRGLAVVVVSIVLLLLGIGLLARAFTQLRFFFGRNRPDSLAPLVAPDTDGDSAAAHDYKETLRQNAITFREPTGPLNGLLYSWLPHLIFAPDVIQREAQVQFHNFLALVATSVSFMLCWIMFGRDSGQGWIGLIYGVFAFVQIMLPMVRRAAPSKVKSADTMRVGTGSLVILIVLAVLGPVLLGVLASRLPDLGQFSINGVVALSLTCTLIGCGVFGLALKNQLQPSPRVVGSARVSETVTLNAHPNKLMEELDRILMTHWYSRIPNRRYTRRLPTVNGAQGQFAAEIFEESQPRPQPNRIATSIGHALSTPQFFWLTCLTGLAMVYLVAGTVAAFLMTRHILAGEPSWTVMSIALSQIAVGMFCYRAAHRLWGRFDFISELIWVETSGSFESAEVHIGNQLSGNVRTTKSVINIEAMTMRVWVSEIDTVIFGKDAERQMIGMRGLQGLADELASSLKGFGEARSMVVAPTSPVDLERAQRIGRMHQLIADPAQTQSADRLAAALLPENENAGAGSSGLLQGSVAKPRFCQQCGTGMEANAKFCGDCGRAAVLA